MRNIDVVKMMTQDQNEIHNEVLRRHLMVYGQL